MGILVQNIDKIRVATGAHVMLVHHTGKVASKGARGSSALRAATDTEVEIEGGVIRMRKQRNWEPARDIGFRLKVVEIGTDEDEDLVTSCVVESGAAADFQPQLTPVEQELLEKIEAHTRKVMKDTGATIPLPMTAEVVWEAINAQPEGEKRTQGEGSAYDSNSNAGRGMRKHLKSLTAKQRLRKVGEYQWVLIT
jgi:hypothetical protein